MTLVMTLWLAVMATHQVAGMWLLAGDDGRRRRREEVKIKRERHEKWGSERKTEARVMRKMYEVMKEGKEYNDLVNCRGLQVATNIFFSLYKGMVMTF